MVASLLSSLITIFIRRDRIMGKETLILNASYEPLTIVPLSLISWKQAIKLLWLDRVDVIDWYEDWIVHSPSTEIQVPAVVVTKEYFNFNKAIRYSRKNLFLRDLYQCQYCGETFIEDDLTVDHVIPKSKGGTTVWTNVVAACIPCNTKKANKYLKPLTVPIKPDYWAIVNKAKSQPVEIKHPSWAKYLKQYKDIEDYEEGV